MFALSRSAMLVLALSLIGLVVTSLPSPTQLAAESEASAPMDRSIEGASADDATANGAQQAQDHAAARPKSVNVVVERNPLRLLEELAEGTYHGTIEEMSATHYGAIQDTEGLTYSSAPRYQLLVTPNAAGPLLGEEQRFNPFYLREVREALHWLIDRERFAREIYPPARARTLPIARHMPDYAELASTARALEHRYRHRPAKAERVIRKALHNQGAQQDEQGRWHFEGEPVRIDVVSYLDEQREAATAYLAELLEGIGFTVRRRHLQDEAFVELWFGSDPQEGGWNLFLHVDTNDEIKRDLGHWLETLFSRHGFPQAVVATYQLREEFEETVQRLASLDVDSERERMRLLAAVLREAMHDAHRIWLADHQAVWPHLPELEVSAHLIEGPFACPTWPHTLRLADRQETPRHEVTLAATSLFNEPWNLLNAFWGEADRAVMASLFDDATLMDPQRGLAHPQRIRTARVDTSDTALTRHNLDWLEMHQVPVVPVPADSWHDWDAEEQRVVTVGEQFPEGLWAHSRITYILDAPLENRQWHDGTPFSLADLIVPWILERERAQRESPHYDEVHAEHYEAWDWVFRGMRILPSSDKVRIEIYTNGHFLDIEHLVAGNAPPWLPWHVLVVGMAAERAGEAAFSYDRARAENVRWMCQVHGPTLETLARQLASLRASLAEAEGGLAALPFAEVLDDWVTHEQAEARFQALAEWHEARGHFLIGDGPFQLHHVDAQAASPRLELRRFEDYPESGKRWQRFVHSQAPYTVISGPAQLEPGEPATFKIQLTDVQEEPFDLEQLTVLQAFVFDVDEGRARLFRNLSVDGGNEHNLELSLESAHTARWGSGEYELEIVARSHHSAKTTLTTHPFTIAPGE